MLSKLLLASATVGLLLAGPQKASAQVLNACVTSIGNISIVAGPNAPCPGGTTTTLSQTPGLLAGLALQCSGAQTAAGGQISFNPSISGVAFGSAISTVGTPPWSSFLLQPGIYQIHLSGGISDLSFAEISAILNGTFGAAIWQQLGNIVVGDRLISVSASNTTLTLVPTVAVTVAPCALIITKVQ